MKYVDLGEIDLPEDPEEYLPETIARQYRVFPIDFEGSSLLIAIADPLEVEAGRANAYSQNPIEPVLADGKKIDQAINDRYDRNRKSEEGVSAEEEVSVTTHAPEGGVELEGPDESDAPIIRLVQVIIAEAVRRRASDIHLEPLDTSFRVPFSHRRRIAGNGKSAAETIAATNHFPDQGDGASEHSGKTATPRWTYSSEGRRH